MFCGVRKAFPSLNQAPPRHRRHHLPASSLSDLTWEPGEGARSSLLKCHGSVRYPAFLAARIFDEKETAL